MHDRAFIHKNPTAMKNCCPRSCLLLVMVCLVPILGRKHVAARLVWSYRPVYASTRRPGFFPAPRTK